MIRPHHDGPVGPPPTTYYPKPVDKTQEAYVETMLKLMEHIQEQCKNGSVDSNLVSSVNEMYNNLFR
ncbi:hypothetical protein AB4114_10995 [Paenibacillus sp. 2RAB27]|uniref:hypothetical protein n=1 Tax=Paenibacillus sp. 2RAB27 TaxID=3232991 RepID=UPI003F9884DC